MIGSKRWLDARYDMHMNHAERIVKPVAHPTAPDHWTIAEVKEMVRRKVVSRIRRDDNRVHQTFKLFTGGTGGREITQDQFRKTVREKFALNLTDRLVNGLFEKLDKDGSGALDAAELCTALFPPDVIVPTADNMHSANGIQQRLEQNRQDFYRQHEERLNTNAAEFHAGLDSNTAVITNWSMDELVGRILEKMQQHTKRPDTVYREAFQLFTHRTGRSSDGAPIITMNDFQSIIQLHLSIPITMDQCRQLFGLIDSNGDGKLQVAEMVTFLTGTSQDALAEANGKRMQPVRHLHKRYSVQQNQQEAIQRPTSNSDSLRTARLSRTSRAQRSREKIKATHKNNPSRGPRQAWQRDLDSDPHASSRRGGHPSRTRAERSDNPSSGCVGKYNYKYASYEEKRAAAGARPAIVFGRRL